jgi:[ribosomal protein S5]-alanine N-acetyltransferase
MFAQTQRLLLRDLTPLDFTDLLTISGHPEVALTNDYLSANPEDLQTWLQETVALESQTPRASHHCAIVQQEDGRLIGWLGFHLLEEGRVVEFGYALHPEQWNQGYMTEAVQAMLDYCFEVLKVQTIKAFHMHNNMSSGKVLQKAGMIPDVQMLEKRLEGEFHYVLTNDDFMVAKAQEQ